MLTIRDILKKDSYMLHVFTDRHQQRWYDPEEVRLIEGIESIFADNELLSWKDNAVKVVKLNVRDQKTMEDIAEDLHVSVRHAYRLRDKGIEIIESILE